jgi:hypothetical protein
MTFPAYMAFAVNEVWDLWENQSVGLRCFKESHENNMTKMFGSGFLKPYAICGL